MAKTKAENDSTLSQEAKVEGNDAKEEVKTATPVPKIIDVLEDNTPIQKLRIRYANYQPPEGMKRRKLPAPNCLIIRYQNGRYIGKEEYIENPIGIPYHNGKGSIFYLTCHKVKDTDTGEIYEELRPLAVQEQIVTLPDSLYRKMYKWWPYKKSVAEALKPSMLEKLKIGVALGFFAISAIALFLIIVSVAG